MKKRLVTYLIFILAVFSVGNVWGYTEGEDNNFFGSYAGVNNTTGTNNSFFGVYSGYLNTEGNANSFFGRGAGRSNTTGSCNTFIGNLAGRDHASGSYNVFLGYSAGYYETGSNKLYISNSDTAYPLIYGDFDNQYLEVNGDLAVKGSTLSIANDSQAFNEMRVHSDTNWHRAAYRALRARGTEASKGALQKGDILFGLDAYGWDGGKYVQSANILAQVDAGVTTDVVPVQWVFRTMDTSGTLGYSMVIRNDGKVGFGTNNPGHLIHLAGGAYSNGATWVNASSRELKENIKEVSAEEAIQTVENLKPVAFTYKEGDKELHVGFIAEDVPELIATNDRKGLEPMDIVAVLTKVVQEQQKTIQELKGEIGQLKTALQFKQDKNADVAQTE